MRGVFPVWHALFISSGLLCKTPSPLEEKVARMLVVVQADWSHISSEFGAVIRLFSDYAPAFGHQLPPFVTIGLKFSRRYLAYITKMVGHERHSSSLSISGGPLTVCIS